MKKITATDIYGGNPSTDHELWVKLFWEEAREKI
jgi:hypothetical protein